MKLEVHSVIKVYKYSLLIQALMIFIAHLRYRSQMCVWTTIRVLVAVTVRLSRTHRLKKKAVKILHLILVAQAEIKGFATALNFNLKKVDPIIQDGVCVCASLWKMVVIEANVSNTVGPRVSETPFA